MDDRMLMEDLLTAVKTGATLYLHGTIESGTANVHGAFDASLCDTLKMQNGIYSKMSQKGWYVSEQAPQQKIDQARQKFSSCC